jgi:hypothetical protein
MQVSSVRLYRNSVYVTPNRKIEHELFAVAVDQKILCVQRWIERPFIAAKAMGGSGSLVVLAKDYSGQRREYL